MKRNGKIELFRFIFCMAIMFCHSQYFLSEENVYSIAFRGYLAVEFFFLVSGYLMAQSINKIKDLPITDLGQETWAFIKKKIKSIMPNFLIAFIIAFCLMPLYWQKPLIETIYILSQSIFEITFISMSGLGKYRVNGVDWYISAMLICMMAQYPLARKKYDEYVHVYAPLIAVLVLGYLFQETGSLGDVHARIGFFYKGTIRAFGELALGASLFPIAQYIRSLKLSSFQKGVYTLIEGLCWSAPVFYMFFIHIGGVDYLILFLFSIAVTLAFGHQGLMADYFDRASVFYFLGSFSLDLYLNHGYWGRVLSSVWANRSYYNILPYYLLISITTAITVHFMSKQVNGIMKKTNRV